MSLVRQETMQVETVETMEMATVVMMAMMMDMSKRPQKRARNLLWQVMKVDWKPWILMNPWMWLKKFPQHMLL